MLLRNSCTALNVNHLYMKQKQTETTLFQCFCKPAPETAAASGDTAVDDTTVNMSQMRLMPSHMVQKTSLMLSYY